MSELNRKVIKANFDSLFCFSREQLREYAKELGVERGRDKSDVIDNILSSGKAKVIVELSR